MPKAATDLADYELSRAASSALRRAKWTQLAGLSDTRGRAAVTALCERDWAARYAQNHPEQFAGADAAARSRVAAVTADVLARPASTWEAP